MSGIALFLPVGAAAVGLVTTGIMASLRRKKALGELAANRRWERTSRDSDLPRTFGGYPPFGEGHGRLARNVMRGRYNDRRVLVFDYHYRTPGSDGDDTHNFWVAGVEDLPAALPPLQVVRRKLLSGRSGGRIGPEILLGHPPFDERYRVFASSPQLAADLLSPDVVRLLMSWPDLQWRVEGRRLITWGRGSLKPHWIEPTLNMLCTLAGAVPAQVWRNVQGPGGF